MGGPGVFAKQWFFPFQNNEVQHILDVVWKKIYRGSCPGYEIQVLQREVYKISLSKISL